MPTLRAGDPPIRIVLAIGSTLTVSTAPGATIYVVDQQDLTPATYVTGTTTTFGPYATTQNLTLTCTSVAGFYDTTSTPASGGLLPVYIDPNTGSLVSEAGNSLSGVITVATSRALTAADNGATLECTATVTLTVPEGLPAGFGCAVIPSGTTSVARSGAALLNGAGTTLTRAAASNAMFAITARASAVDSYVVTGV